MHYVFQALAAILIGVSLGTILGPRSTPLFIGALLAIILGIVTIVLGSWIPLILGVAVFLIAQGMDRNTAAHRV